MDYFPINNIAFKLEKKMSSKQSKSDRRSMREHATLASSGPNARGQTSGLNAWGQIFDPNSETLGQVLGSHRRTKSIVQILNCASHLGPVPYQSLYEPGQ